MSAPVVEQVTNVDAGASATPAITLTEVTTGNLLTLMVTVYGVDRALMSITDSQSNAWSVVATSTFSNGKVLIAWAVAGSTGNVTVTVTWGASTSTHLGLIEASNPHATPFDASGVMANVSGTTHFCAVSGEIDTAENVLVVALGICGSTPGTITVPSDHTVITTAVDSGEGWMSYIRSTAALTDYRGQWSITTARVSRAAIASFKAAAVAGSTRGMPFGNRGTAFNGGRALRGPIAC